MAFLDNSGDIILDAVLTDAGRQRMARGNFKITKFALGDEEINYAIFNGSHTSGSAFYDLEIMQTPVLEAFTNNTSMMKSKLVTIGRNNILYMPILKLNDLNNNGTSTDASGRFPGGYILLADAKTEEGNLGRRLNAMSRGILRGGAPNISGDVTNHIAVDQGINTSAGGQSFKHSLDDDLVETAFLIRMDHRLLRLHQVNSNPDAGRAASTTRSLINQFVDDDGVASYYVALADGTTCVEGKPGNQENIDDSRGEQVGRRGAIIGSDQELTLSNINEVFAGPLGSILRFYPRASEFVRQSDALFTELGNTVTSGADISLNAERKTTAYKYIDTLVNVVGVTTGYSIDIPIRIVKGTTFANV